MDYQGNHGNVRALAMKKWFNTNYHYMVPEIEDNTKIQLVGTKLFDEFDEALKLEIKTKPVLTGPFTLLKLIRYTGTKQLLNFIDFLTNLFHYHILYLIQIINNTKSATSIPGNRPYKKAGGAGLVPKVTKKCISCMRCVKQCPQKSTIPHII